MGAEIFRALKRTLHDRGLSTAVGDEGGFAPDLDSNEEALKALMAASRRPACPGRRLAIALDPATSEIFENGLYQLAHEGGRSPRLRSSPTGATLLSLPGHLDRGRARRGGLGRLEARSRASSATACNW